MDPFETYQPEIDDEYLTELSDYYSDYGEYRDRAEEEEEDEEEVEDEENKDAREAIDIFADLVMRLMEERSEKKATASEAKKERLRGLIGVKKKRDLSEETLITPEEESVISLRASTESSIHPCLKEIAISESQLKLCNLFTKYPIPDDPGLVPAFWTTQEGQVIYPDDGTAKFYDLTTSSHLQPIQSVKNMLFSDSINLQYYGLNPRVIRPLCEALMKNHLVETVNLSGNWLSEDACYHLNDLLVKNTIITTLLLSGCQIGPEGAAKFHDGLVRNITLTTLDLSNCNIRNEGLDHIATAMCSNESIEHLFLGGNHLDESCADALQKLASCPNSLSHLDLSWNSLYTAETWKKFSKALENNDILVDLDLSWNALGKECVQYIRRLLSHSLVLKKLVLSGNRFYNEDIGPIAKGLQSNTTLEELYLDDNPFKADGVFTLLKALAPNKSPNSQLRVLSLENIWASKNVLPELEAIKNEKPWMEIKLGGILSNYKLEGPDVKAILLKRATYEAMKPKNKKNRKNFGHFVLSLTDDVIPKGKFLELMRNYRLKLSQSLVQLILVTFAAEKNTVDQKLMKSDYMKVFPDTTLPSEKYAKQKKVSIQQSTKNQAKVKKKT